MSDRAPVRLNLLHMLPHYLEEQGVASGRVLARAGIMAPIERNPSRIVARAQICAALDESARILGDRTLGLGLAGAADPNRLGLTGRALVAGMTLRQCFQGHFRFMPSLQSGVRLDLMVRGNTASWCHQLVGSDCEAVRVLAEGAAAFTVYAIRHIVGSNWSPAMITFPHRARVHPQVYEDFFQAPVQFSMGNESVIIFGANILASTNKGIASSRPPGSVGLEALDLSRERREIDDFELSDEKILEAVDCIIASMLTLGRLSLPDVAQTLGHAPRTLQRRIARLGTSFEEITDRRRRACATELLADRSLSIVDIAMAAGYSDSAHFIRAFHRWERTSPMAFRQAQFDAAENP